MLNKTKMNMTCVSSHRCLGSLVVRKKEFQIKGFISLEEINLSRQKQNYRLYLFDQSLYFPAKHVIYILSFAQKLMLTRMGWVISKPSYKGLI